MTQHFPITGRMTAPRKAQILHDIAHGKLSLDNAKLLYNLSNAELSEWLDKHAKGDLRVYAAWSQPPS